MSQGKEQIEKAILELEVLLAIDNGCDPDLNFEVVHQARELIKDLKDSLEEYEYKT